MDENNAYGLFCTLPEIFSLKFLLRINRVVISLNHFQQPVIPFSPIQHICSPVETAESIRSTLKRDFSRTAFEVILRETTPPVLTLRWWDGPSRSVLDTTLEDFRSRKWDWQKDADGELYSEEWREAHTVVEASGLLGYRMYFDMTFDLDRHFTLPTLTQAATRIAEQYSVEMPVLRDTNRRTYC